MAGLIKHVDIAFFSAADLSSQEAYELAHSMRALGPSIVVITRGALGALAVDALGIHEQPSIPCTVVDSMGAGDGFIAAFLLAWQARHSLAECLLHGVDYAAQVCGWTGGFGHGQSLDPERSLQLKQALNAQADARCPGLILGLFNQPVVDTLSMKKCLIGLMLVASPLMTWGASEELRFGVDPPTHPLSPSDLTAR